GTGTAPAATVTPNAIAFGNQPTGSTSAATSISVTNSGSAPLVIGAIAMAGTNAADFAKVSDLCSNTTVAPGATCTLGVSFSPSATGARTASLSISDNAAGSPQSVALSGTGTAPVASLSSPTMAFGNQP